MNFEDFPVGIGLIDYLKTQGRHTGIISMSCPGYGEYFEPETMEEKLETGKATETEEVIINSNGSALDIKSCKLNEGDAVQNALDTLQCMICHATAVPPMYNCKKCAKCVCLECHDTYGSNKCPQRCGNNMLEKGQMWPMKFAALFSIPCPQRCGSEIALSGLQRHINERCSCRPIVCLFDHQLFSCPRFKTAQEFTAHCIQHDLVKVIPSEGARELEFVSEAIKEFHILIWHAMCVFNNGDSCVIILSETVHNKFVHFKAIQLGLTNQNVYVSISTNSSTLTWAGCIGDARKGLKDPTSIGVLPVTQPVKIKINV